MKYKLINKQTNEEHLCDKVTIDGFDYYVNDGEIKESSWCYDIALGIFQASHNYHSYNRNLCKKVIATNNPNIDIPKVVDEVEMLANIEYPFAFGGIGNIENTSKNHFIKGYNKSQETHPFSEEDMIEFALYVANVPHTPYKPVKELLQLWKEQRIKTLYYE